jgi:hypothetical protein
MKTAYKIMITVFVMFVLPARAVTVSVPGTSDPWLAGMPNGSTASYFDSAPAQSPVLAGISIVPGASYVFIASGLVDHGVTPPSFNGPEGDINSLTIHWPGAENGIADLLVPFNALVGVFLDSNQPNLTGAPGSLDFSTSGSRNFASLTPLLKQPFFIGDGKTASGTKQYFTAPAGATRLFLGTMDNYEWSNNNGSFDVNVVAEAPPSLLLLVPDGGEKWVAGTSHNIEWYVYDPNIHYVLIEYSANNGQTWNEVDIWENTGSYEWSAVPAVDSNQCLLRVSDLFNPGKNDITDGAFTIFRCLHPIAGDLNGDCYVDLYDFTVIADHWLDCGNPFDSACQQ